MNLTCDSWSLLWSIIQCKLHNFPDPNIPRAVYDLVRVITCQCIHQCLMAVLQCILPWTNNLLVKWNCRMKLHVLALDTWFRHTCSYLMRTVPHCILEFWGLHHMAMIYICFNFGSGNALMLANDQCGSATFSWKVFETDHHITLDILNQSHTPRGQWVNYVSK